MHPNLQKCFLDIPRNIESSESVSDQYVKQQRLEGGVQFSDNCLRMDSQHWVSRNNHTILILVVSAFLELPPDEVHNESSPP